MIITLNNRKTDVKEADKLTVKELLNEVKYTFPNIIVKINNQLVKKDQWATAIVKDGDKVDAIHMVSGG